MPSAVDQLFEDVAAPLNEEFFGVSIVYSRGGVNSAPLTAIAETTTYELLDDRLPHTTVAAGRDYTLKSSTLIVNSLVIEPAVGDRITETIAGASWTFEVLPLADKPSAELLPGGFRWLIHTKRVV